MRGVQQQLDHSARGRAAMLVPAESAGEHKRERAGHGGGGENGGEGDHEEQDLAHREGQRGTTWRPGNADHEPAHTCYTCDPASDVANGSDNGLAIAAALLRADR